MIALVYVNAVDGDDANDGLTPSTAKKTFEAALDALPRGGGIVPGPGDDPFGFGAKPG